MSGQTPWFIRLLDSHHDRQEFDCGVPSLNNYLHRQASQDMRRSISRVFVAAESQTASRIAGYYTLSGLSLDVAQFPADIKRKLPKHPIPAALLGRLAVAASAQGQGTGRLLLADALWRTQKVSDQIGLYALVVDALNDEAQRFYHRFGFLPMDCSGRRLLLPLKSL